MSRRKKGFTTKERRQRNVLAGMLADEIADTVIYLDLLAAYAGIDLATAIRRKFNAVSEREGFPERLEA